MEAGKLRHLVTIERPVYLRDDTGERVIDRWEIVASPWAEVRPVKADESEEAGRNGMHRVTHLVRLRYTEDITPDCRVNFEGRKLEIIGLQNVDERNREIRIQASELTNTAAT